MQIQERADMFVRTATGIVVAIVAVVIGHAFVKAEPSRYMMVDELVMKRLDSELGREVRVHGFVKPDSIGRGANESRFVLEKNGVAIRVRVHGELSDCVRPGSEVVVRGTLRVDADDWYLDVTDVDARCPTKYAGPRSDCHQRASTDYR